MGSTAISNLLFPNNTTIFQYASISYSEFISMWSTEKKIILLGVWRLWWKDVTGIFDDHQTLLLSTSHKKTLDLGKSIWNKKNHRWEHAKYSHIPPETYSWYYFSNGGSLDAELPIWFGVVKEAVNLGILTQMHKKETVREIEIFHQYVKFPLVYLKGLSAVTQQEIWQAWNHDHVVVLTGGTGVGKTSQIPKLFFWFGFLFGNRQNIENFKQKTHWDNEMDTGKPVCISLPRTELVRQVSKNLLAGLGFSALQDSVIMPKYGNMDTEYTNTNMPHHYGLVISTHRITIRNLHEYENIIIDEVHEHDIYADILISIVNKDKNRQHFSIDTCVLMSATIEEDRARMLEFFTRPKFIHIEGKTLWEITEVVDPVPENYDENKFNYLRLEKQKVLDVMEKYFPAPGSCGILFLARIGQCEDYKTMLDKKFPHFDNIIIHGKVENIPAIIQSVYLSKKTSILISTPYLESSITIPNCTIVYDLGRYWRKTLETGQEAFVTRAMGEQRKGRVGRVSPGLYIKLFSDYNSWNRIDGEELYPYIIFTSVLFHANPFDERDMFILLKDPTRWKMTKKYLLKLVGKIDDNVLDLYNNHYCSLIEFLTLYIHAKGDLLEELNLWDTTPDYNTLSPALKKVLVGLGLKTRVVSSRYNKFKNKFLIFHNIEYGPNKGTVSTTSLDKSLAPGSILYRIHNFIFVQ